MLPPTYKITSKVWLWESEPPKDGKIRLQKTGSWHFADIPVDTTEEIKAMFGYLSGGWGSLPVKLTIGKTTWQTSIFPNKKTGGYLIPLKAEVRKAEKISVGDMVEIVIGVRV